MDRRNFFKNALARTVNAGVGAIEQRAQAKAKHWFRPPFAKDELDFLLDCTRCNACIEACPHEVIFPLPLRRGAEVAGTPALDIVNKGCHLCSDWPCVGACSDRALVFPTLAGLADKSGGESKGENSGGEEESSQQQAMPTALECPPLGKAVVNSEVCIAYMGPECGACRGTCPLPDTLLWQGEKPHINPDSCVGCGLCREACITSPKAIDIHTIASGTEP